MPSLFCPVSQAISSHQAHLLERANPRSRRCLPQLPIEFTSRTSGNFVDGDTGHRPRERMPAVRARLCGRLSRAWGSRALLDGPCPAGASKADADPVPTLTLA